MTDHGVATNQSVACVTVARARPSVSIINHKSYSDQEIFFCIRISTIFEPIALLISDWHESFPPSIDTKITDCRSFETIDFYI